MKTVEIVVPVFNEEEGINEFYKVISSLTNELKNYRFSFIFVDDGSSDNSLSMIKYLAKEDRRVKYISFSRNFGKEAAIYAGLQHSTADYTILMDADLQHPPTLIPEMLKNVDSGEWDACGAKRRSGFMSRLYNGVNNKMSTVKLQSGATDYMCMNRKFVDAVMSLSERQRFTKGLFAWVGFRVKWLDYVQNPRTMGKTKWSFRKLVSYAMDGLSGFSTIPLKLVTWAGAIICLLALIYIIITLIQTLIHGIDVPGYVTTLVVMLFLGGIILLSVGILGDYIGRIFLEIKNRPLYITDSSNIRLNSENKAVKSKPKFQRENVRPQKTDAEAKESKSDKQLTEAKQEDQQMPDGGKREKAAAPASHKKHHHRKKNSSNNNGGENISQKS